MVIMLMITQVRFVRLENDKTIEIVGFVDAGASIGATYTREGESWIIKSIYKSYDLNFMAPADCLYRAFKRDN